MRYLSTFGGTFNRHLKNIAKHWTSIQVKPPDTFYHGYKSVIKCNQLLNT
ncbi:hypothetical protein AALD74_25125 [Lachnospiraceae bacterium 48-21]|nr:hypothetical protein [Dorea sp.]